MAATATYKQFLASPSASLLAPTATLYYVTTGTVVSGDEIIKHLSDLRSKLKKKKEEILGSIEGTGAIAAEVETEIEFVLGGGAYLPGMDENFLTDRTVYMVIMHIVTFEDDKISQIRLSWDQGALLKQLDVIGKTGRNWPIRDSREQLSTISACLRKAASAVNGHANGHSNGHNSGAQNGHSNGAQNGNRERQNTGGFIHRDPHASLVLFGSRDQTEQVPNVVSPYAGSRPAQRSFTDILGDDQPDAQPTAVVSPYAGAKRQQRTFEEILGNEEDDEQGPPSPSAGRGRSDSSNKAKGGSNKNFAPNRLFDGVEHREEEDDDKEATLQRFYRPDPSKYNHFDFADGPDPDETTQPAPPRENGKKHKSEANWSFDDFETPAKPQLSKAYQQTRDTRHWDLQDESVTQETPHYRAPPAGKPRPDANTHFDEPTAAPLSNITNIKDRQKAFDPQYAIADKSPALKENASRNPAPEADMVRNEHGINIAGDGMGGRKGTDRSWMIGGEEPEPPKEKIVIAGDGMGGRKGTDRSWMTGGDDEPQPTVGKEKITTAGDGMGGRKGTDNSWRDDGDEQPHSINIAGNGMGSRKANDQRWKRDDDEPTTTVSAKIAIAGDGMGGRKGTDRSWMTGGDDDDYSAPANKQKIVTTGDGMGGRKGADNSWREDGDERPHGINVAGNGMGSRKANDQRWKQDEGTNEGGKIVIAGDGMGGRKDADNSWRYGGDDSAAPGQQQGARKANNQRWGHDESTNEGGKIAIAGDGMGGRKDADNSWRYGGGDEDAAPSQQQGARKANDQRWERETVTPKKQGITIAGDGMGGRKGADRGWMYGEDDEEEAPPKRAAASNNNNNNNRGWDF
jgi:hypothetical protein